ncbi:adenylate/guanylate cyclase domain-containing protein [Pedobacter endophyticus]|uniref:Adenylate/guanylate cyclase domain-containing protein n=1 Tax=Pedobacter endophyticus TaxID=2789740 RepID=A0A7U3Q4W4_9SPHI|nr:adenylate/guanylate cyclase domain-containing protein [Pedobacter endophyticus]QPH38634.1 adenylate/guanylate cyclase domain-containing protein [Pedobacter endophyticus]
MPNLLQIQAFREKYAAKTIVSRNEIKLLAENFSKPTHAIKSLFVQRGLDDHIIDYFESQKSANIVLLFIDITDFSSKCRSWPNSTLSTYLDDYYDKVIKLIYHHGGEVEKIIGDGIICMFGEPFLTGTKAHLFQTADACAKDIIVEAKGSSREVKIALHDGEIMYYKNKSENFPEYTMIGKPLTELFRLESVATNNSINYFHVSDYDSCSFCTEGVYKYSLNNTHSYWKKSGVVKVDLKGVEWTFIKNFTCTYKT